MLMFIALFTLVAYGSVKEREVVRIPKEYYNKNLQFSVTSRILDLKSNWTISYGITYMNNLIK